MSKTLEAVKFLVSQRRVRVSDHGFDELRADGLKLTAIVRSIDTAELVEDYPDAFKGPTVLALHTFHGAPIHVVWGLTETNPDIATLVTAYVPDVKKWYDDFKQRRPK